MAGGVEHDDLGGLAVGRATSDAIAAGEPAGAGARYRRLTGPMLDSHLRHIQVAARLCRSGTVIDAGLRSSAADQKVFDALVELGLARGRITRTMVRGLARGLFGPPPRYGATHHNEETA